MPETESRERIAALEAERDYWRQTAERATVAARHPVRDRAARRLVGDVPPGEEPIDRAFAPEPLTHRDVLSIWLGRAGIVTLRVSLGAIFLLFGVLKYFADVSPAERISVRTVDELTLGVITGDTARVLVATMEVAIGVCLLSGKFLKAGLALLAVAMVGIMAPLVLFTDELFAGKHNAPTLLGQYVLKDFVLLAAGVVVVARELGKPAEPGADHRER